MRQQVKNEAKNKKLKEEKPPANVEAYLKNLQKQGKKSVQLKYNKTQVNSTMKHDELNPKKEKTITDSFLFSLFFLAINCFK